MIHNKEAVFLGPLLLIEMLCMTRCVFPPVTTVSLDLAARDAPYLNCGSHSKCGSISSAGQFLLTAIFKSNNNVKAARD